MRRRSFRIRLALTTMVLVALPLAVVGWFLIDVNRRELEDRTRDRLFAVIDDVAHTVDGSLAEAELTVGGVARLLADPSLPEEQRLAVAASLIEAAPAVRAIAIFDGNGVAIDVLAEGGADEPVPAALDAATRQQALAAPVALLPAVPGSDGPRVIMVVAVRGAAATWFAAAPVTLDDLQERVERIARDQFGEDLESVRVIDRARRVLADPDPERAFGLPTLPRTGALAALPDDLAGTPVLVYGEYGDRVSAARSLDVAPWIVVAQRPRAEVFASVTRMRRTVVAGIAAALVLALGLAWFATARLAAPVKTLTTYAGDLAHRRWERRVELHTGDELEELARAMSGAAHELATSERRLARERQLRGDLGRYLPAQLVDNVVAGAQDLRLGGERRTLTVMFADVASFTSLVERRGPEEVATLLNQLFTILTEIVFRHGGTVDKFMGDCVMAFWGAPAAQPDHGARAVRAAEDMLRWLEVGNEAWQATWGVTVHLAIGIHTGEAVVGNFGSETRMEYTCVGDTVNVASRLEALARPQQILVSTATREAAPAADYLEVGSYHVPGRTEAVELHEVMWR